MSVSHSPIWANEVTSFIKNHNLTVVASPTDLTEMILNGTLYWETPLNDGRRLMLVRLSSPVIMREEVMLGNILFNDFLNKSVVYSVAEAELGEVLPITNDLENAYYLILTRADLMTVSQTVWDYVASCLPDLFFGSENIERGIHGTLEKMVSFTRSDYEPFPVFAVPIALSKQLEVKVRQILLHLLETQPLVSLHTKGKTITQHPSFALRTVQAGMAFFYGQDGNETQSQPELMARAVTKYKFLTLQELTSALQFLSLQDGLEKEKELTTISKPLKNTLTKRGYTQNVIEASYASILETFIAEETDLPPVQLSTLDEEARQLVKHEILKKLVKRAIGNASVAATFDEEKLRGLLTKMMQYFAKSIDEQGDESDWFLGSIIKKEKFLPVNVTSYTSVILSHVTFGTNRLADVDEKENQRITAISCRICGSRPATVDEKDVLLGNSGQFHNQKPNHADNDIRRACEVCALYGYLTAKQIGYRSDPNKKGVTVPHRGNLIFHYGRHSAAAAQTIGKQINVIRDLLQQIRQARLAVWEANKKIKKEKEKQRFSSTDEEAVALMALNNKLEAETITPEEMQQLETLIEKMVYQSTQAREVVETIGSAHVVDIGLGEQRLIVFALENLYDERDLAQKRFARNRVAIFALLAFLQEVCGCDGPYYFQSLPRVDVEYSTPNVFYIGHRQFEAAKYRRQYETLSRFAHHVIPGYGIDALKKRLKLAEDLADYPLETFSAVLRDSPIRPNDERDKYRFFVGKADKKRFDRSLGVFDSWSYLEVYRILSELEEGL